MIICVVQEANDEPIEQLSIDGYTCEQCMDCITLLAVYTFNPLSFSIHFLAGPSLGPELDYPLFYISPIVEMCEKPHLPIYNLEVTSGRNAR